MICPFYGIHGAAVLLGRRAKVPGRKYSIYMPRPLVESKVLLVTDFRGDDDGPYCG
jgi:hypothetical protein